MFSTSHAKLLSLARAGVVAGLRIDHPDGLADPAGYLQRLAGEGITRIWVEKILEPGERLRDWPVCGTVGYEFLNDACALYVDPAGERLVVGHGCMVARNGHAKNEIKKPDILGCAVRVHFFCG